VTTKKVENLRKAPSSPFLWLTGIAAKHFAAYFV